MSKPGKHKCCICKKVFFGWGNNPWPVVRATGGRAVCCDQCNLEVVVTARIKEAQKQQKGDADEV